MAKQEEQAIYSIGAVARMLDVPSSTLRGWEERYGVVTPRRSEGSQRLYSRSQVEQLRFIKLQLESGNSAADAHRLLSQHLAAGASVFLTKPLEPLKLVSSVRDLLGTSALVRAARQAEVTL